MQIVTSASSKAAMPRLRIPRPGFQGRRGPSSQQQKMNTTVAESISRRMFVWCCNLSQRRTTSDTINVWFRVESILTSITLVCSCEMIIKQSNQIKSKDKRHTHTHLLTRKSKRNHSENIEYKILVISQNKNKEAVQPRTGQRHG